MMGHTALLVYLLPLVDDVSPADILYWRPLHLAAYKGHEEAVRVLLNAGSVGFQKGVHGCQIQHC